MDEHVTHAILLLENTFGFGFDFDLFMRGSEFNFNFHSQKDYVLPQNPKTLESIESYVKFGDGAARHVLNGLDGLDFKRTFLWTV